MKASARSSMRIIAAAASSSFEVKCLYRLALAMPTSAATSSTVIRSKPFSASSRLTDDDDRVLAGAQHLFTERHLGHAAILGARGCIRTPESLCD